MLQGTPFHRRHRRGRVVTATRLLSLWVALALLAAAAEAIRLRSADAIPPVPAGTIAVADLRSPAALAVALERLAPTFPALDEADARLRQADGLGIDGLWRLFGVSRVVLAYGETTGTPWIWTRWDDSGAFPAETEVSWIARRLQPARERVKLLDESLATRETTENEGISVTSTPHGTIITVGKSAIATHSSGNAHLLTTDGVPVSGMMGGNLAETIENQGFRTYRPAEDLACRVMTLHIPIFLTHWPIVAGKLVSTPVNTSFSFGNAAPEYVCGQ